MSAKNNDKTKLFAKFPKVLREALYSNIVSFSDNIETIFDPFEVYRGIVREEDNSDIIITKDDFKSHIEIKARGANKTDIHSYGCSVFSNIDGLKIALKLPRKNRFIIKGYATDKNGIIERSRKSSHVEWWLYENNKVENDFEVIKYE